MSSNFKILFTLYAFSCVRYKVAFVSQYPNTHSRSVNLYVVLLYTHGAFVYVFVYLAYFIAAFFTLKNYESV